MPAQIKTAKTKFEIKLGAATREAFGRTLVELGRENKDVVVVDYNPHVSERLRARGVQVVYGDISQRATLEHAAIERQPVNLRNVGSGREILPTRLRTTES